MGMSTGFKEETLLFIAGRAATGLSTDCEEHESSGFTEESTIFIDDLETESIGSKTEVSTSLETKLATNFDTGVRMAFVTGISCLENTEGLAFRDDKSHGFETDK